MIEEKKSSRKRRKDISVEEGEEEEEEKNIKESINYEFTSHVPEEDERFYTTHIE